MQRRRFLKQCARKGTQVIETLGFASLAALHLGSRATAQSTPCVRFETDLAIYEKRSTGDWITLKSGTSMAAMTQEVHQLKLPFNVLAKNNGEFVLDQVRATLLHNRPLSPGRLLV